MKKILITVLLFLPSISQANNKNDVSIDILDKNIILCDTRYSRNSDDAKYKECVNAVFFAYDNFIKQHRSDSNFKNKDEWKAFQLNEIKQNSICQEYAKGSTTNTILLRNLYFCQHIMYLNLAKKASEI